MTQKSDEDLAQDLAHEVFSKCFLVLLAHVQRRMAKDPEYEEPRFLRAFLVAFSQADKPGLKDGEHFIGVSTSEDSVEGYAVVMKKSGSKTEIVELRDIARDKTVGQREMMRLMQLSILLDNMPTKSVAWPKAIEALNLSVPGVQFVKFPNNQWRKYRDKISDGLLNGQMPQISATSQEAMQLMKAKSFFEIPQQLRTMIGVMYAQSKYPKGRTMSITSPEKTVDKHKVFEMAKDIIYGYGAEYLKPMEFPENS